MSKDVVIPGKAHMQKQSSQSSDEMQLHLTKAFDLG